MTVTAPEWLSKRGGEFEPSPDGRAWLVLFNQEPLYILTPTPAAGAHACQIKQTNNGKRLDKPTKSASVDDALRSGLEDLRKVLGW